MQPSELYMVAGHSPALLLSVVGRVRRTPHKLLVLVSRCTKCEEDVAMYDEETRQLHLAKSGRVVTVALSDNAEIAWTELCLPPPACLSTTPFPLAVLPARGRAARVARTHPRYRSAYTQHCRALAQYTQCDDFVTQLTIRPWTFQACLSWIMTPPPLPPPAHHTDCMEGLIDSR